MCDFIRSGRSQFFALLLLTIVTATLSGCVATSRSTGWDEPRTMLPEVMPPAGEVWERGESKVFTIFAFGTGDHRHGRSGALVGELAAAYWGRGATNEFNRYYEEHYQRTFLILDGVGTTSAPAEEDGDPIGLATDAFPDHPMPGDFWPDRLSKPLKPKAFRVSNMVLAKTLWTSHRGDLMGDGWDDNVMHALFVLGRLHDADQFPEVINLIGFSRGGVTALKLAHAINKYFVNGEPVRAQLDYINGYAPDNMIVAMPARANLVPAHAFEVNMFIVDPVPGRFGGDGETFGSKRSIERFPPEEIDYQEIPGIVNDCIITLANDEQREGYAPLDADDVAILNPMRTRAVWLPFPGIHNTAVRPYLHLDVASGSEAAGEIDLNSVPIVVSDLAIRFLKSHGTAFHHQPQYRAAPDSRPLTSAEIVNFYARMWLDKTAYHSERNRGPGNRVMGGLMPRVYTGYPFGGREYSGVDPIQRERDRKDLFTSSFGTYVEHPGFFINEHHRACFEAAYPAAYLWLTGSGGAVPQLAAEEILSLDESSSVVVQLERLGLERSGGTLQVSDTFRFGSLVGEPLRHDEMPLKARFTGIMSEMQVIDP